MGPERNEYEQIVRNQLRFQKDAERTLAAAHDDGEDWPMLAALIGGLVVALIANNFFGLISG